MSPGESFNDAIKESLNKSDLFALAVTPNLLDDPNYIMDIEYPAAMESGKDIFPVEMLPTNSKELKEKYPGIPDAEDKNSIERFSKRLASIAEKSATMNLYPGAGIMAVRTSCASTSGTFPYRRESISWSPALTRSLACSRSGMLFL